MGKQVRVGSANGGSAIRRAVTIEFRLTAGEVADHVDRALGILEGLVRKGGEAGCDVLALPEDSMGLAPWESAHGEAVGDVLPAAVACMLDRLGRAAAAYGMYLVCASDTWEAEGSGGAVRNTAFFLGRDGREIGRYHKVNLPAHEQLKRPGDGFPVFPTPDLGGVGMLICYDMIFPEAARCLALGGAHILFDPTEGGAAFGGPEISRAAYRTRAVENFAYLVVSWGGWGDSEGSLIVSPQGKILAEEMRPGEIAVADIDPFGGRQNEDWANRQEDMRARLFRERRPEAFSILTDPLPPVLNTLPDMIPGPAREIARMVDRATTVGHGQYEAAEEYLRAGRLDRAAEAFEALIREYPATWFERTSRERLASLRETGGA
jgi:predicted amidohydrolase